MIKYSLRCSKGHPFEAWFRSSEVFDRQSRRRLVECPACGDTAVDRQPMAPAIVRGRSKSPLEVPPDAAPATADPPPCPPIEVMRALKRHVLANSEDVGTRFAEEARRIHEGDGEQRSIRGVTTPSEARGLIEDDIPFGVLPDLPEDHH